MTRLADQAARHRALTEFGSSLIVEAGAGTGKTSLLAGRLALLLASGVDPEAVAAITFTESSAAELAARVRDTIESLLRGVVPRFMETILPDGPTREQGEHLRRAIDRLDHLTTATIHGFCQELIRGYAVEADIDPGHRTIDRDAADLAFDDVFDAWLRRRLGAASRSDDPVAVLARADPKGVAGKLRELGRFRVKHRSARPPAGGMAGRPDLVLQDAVLEFRRWSTNAPAEDGTSRLVGDLERLAAFYAGSFASPQGFAELWRLAHPPRIACMRKGAFELVRPRRLSIWRRLAGDEGGARLDAESLSLFDRVDAAFGSLLGQVGAALVATLSDELDEVLSDYAGYKRAAAVVDFDDLIETTARLLRRHEAVRSALAGRYRHLLVDEFQDTDPLQCEIIFRLSTDEPTADWRQIRPRAGALFLVGDPKQAIYQFRGAHVDTYDGAKDTLLSAWPGHLLRITANFRSRQGIIGHVNAAFAGPLNGAGQPGHVDLDPTRDDLPDRPSVARLSIPVAPRAGRGDVQDAEAEVVAATCGRLIGETMITDDLGRTRPVTAGDIALLAPTGTDLWRYERALQHAGVPFASQAGKGLLRRQEAQDFLALARTLASGRDTLAFGALMRGPLVGLTDEAILDIAEGLPTDRASPGRFTVHTPVDLIADPVVRSVIATLQDLRRQSRSTSPLALLTSAVERLHVRAILAMRDPRRAGAASANIDVLLERASRYDLRGLASFVQDLTADWERNRDQGEGQPDAVGGSVQIVTVHGAKGLEWPIVLPINTAVGFKPRGPFVHRASDDTLHWTVGNVGHPELLSAVAAEADSVGRERVRLWYVACTRAKDLLVLPRLPSGANWAGIVDLRHDDLPELQLPSRGGGAIAPPNAGRNMQDAATFATEAALVAERSKPMAWLRPSNQDGDLIAGEDIVAEDIAEAVEGIGPVEGGRVRGIILHKLMEEVIEEGLETDGDSLARRATLLASQVPTSGSDPVLDPAELAATMRRTLTLPDVATLLPRLRAEVPIQVAMRNTAGETLLSGRADAIAIDDGGRIEVVLDWKSDTAPSTSRMRAHVDQISLYLAATGAKRGLIVYMSSGTVRAVDLSAQDGQTE